MRKSFHATCVEGTEFGIKTSKEFDKIPHRLKSVIPSESNDTCNIKFNTCINMKVRNYHVTKFEKIFYFMDMIV